jgi:D-alanyl-D-alanine carboxypeptidase
MIRSSLLAIGLAFWVMPVALAQVPEEVRDHTGLPDPHQLADPIKASELTHELAFTHRSGTAMAEKHQLLPLPLPPLPQIAFSDNLGSTIRWVNELAWAGASPQEIIFMRRVYIRQMERAATKLDFQPSTIGEKVVPIESGQSALPEVAKACRAMLKAARESGGATRFSVLSAYRPARKQFVNWQLNFPEYYRRTASERSRVLGGSLGDEAVELLAMYTEQRLASPGYSLHNAGIAIDFITYEGGREFSALTQADVLSGWKRTWFYHWLSENAERFHFFQNARLDEPWHWEYRP